MKLHDILFLDIETVGNANRYEEMSERLRVLWNNKAKQLAKHEDDTPESLYSKAAIYAEFGKVVCISVAYFQGEKLRVTSFCGEDEAALLADFAAMLNKYFSEAKHRLCAHNGKEFDFPYLCRRMLVNKIKLPSILDVQGKKPWETSFLDTMELWKFGDYKHYTSLELLAAIFNIPTPKDDITGEMVHKVFWQEHDLQRIRTYCEKDALTVAQLMRCYAGEPLISKDDIVYV